MPKVSKDQHRQKMAERKQKKDYIQLLKDGEYDPRILDELVKLGMVEEEPVEDEFTMWIRNTTQVI